jgi:ribosome-binding factor A
MNSNTDKGRSKGTGAPSQRQLQVGEELRHALAWALERGEVHDPAVAAQPLTVTEVRVSPDLKNATAYVVALGGRSTDMTEALAGLRRAQPLLRRLLAERVRLRYAPNIAFAADTAFDNAASIDDLLHRPEVARDLDEADDGA